MHDYAAASGSEESWMALGRPPAPLPRPGTPGLGALGLSLPLVVPAAQRLEVGVRVIVVRHDVVDVRRWLGAARAVGHDRSASAAIPGEDAPPDRRPVLREAATSGAAGPGHHASSVSSLPSREWCTRAHAIEPSI